MGRLIYLTPSAPVVVHRGNESTTLLHAPTEVALEQPDEQVGPEAAEEPVPPPRYGGRQEKVERGEPEEEEDEGREPGDPPHIGSLPEGARGKEPQALRAVEPGRL